MGNSNFGSLCLCALCILSLNPVYLVYHEHPSVYEHTSMCRHHHTPPHSLLFVDTTTPLHTPFYVSTPTHPSTHPSMCSHHHTPPHTLLCVDTTTPLHTPFYVSTPPHPSTPPSTCRHHHTPPHVHTLLCVDTTTSSTHPSMCKHYHTPPHTLLCVDTTTPLHTPFYVLTPPHPLYVDILYVL